MFINLKMIDAFLTEIEPGFFKYSLIYVSETPNSLATYFFLRPASLIASSILILSCIYITSLHIHNVFQFF